ncbi:N-formylglutamate amidohydrolase [Xanthobacter sp. DSM 24535]|uniref:N-formylglutamate amidohydrolase n=1 Tax=Roseixanthobacter psychrophilus TaxID=3119917 RepID=UPI0037264380
MAHTFLGADEPAPVTVHNARGRSPFLLVADHAGDAMPRVLGRLGLPQSECRRHIAIDIGIAGVSRALADALDATLIQQNYSRLVIDCNRPPGTPTSIPEVSERTGIPGNLSVSAAEAAARARAIFQPYHDRIEAELETRRLAGRPVVLVSMHSFTPVYLNAARPWHAGVLYNRDPRLAHLLLGLLRREDGLVVGDNEPYNVSDDTDYTIPVHGERRGIPHVAIEIRQDLIGDGPGQLAWSARFTRLLTLAYRGLDETMAAAAAS